MNRIFFGDCRTLLRAFAIGGVEVQTCVTSPPYFGLRDYGHEDQLGLEVTPAEYVANMVEVFRGVRDVLADDGTLWLNIGDSYAGSGGRGSQGGEQFKNHAYGEAPIARSARYAPAGEIKTKDLLGIPWMLAFALRADGWFLRQDIIWHKPNPMPESVTDRCTKAHEYIFLLSKSQTYYFDSEAMREPAVGGAPGNKKPLKGVGSGGPDDKHRTRGGSHLYAERAREKLASGAAMTRNRRSVWTVATRPYAGAHFATFPPALIAPCVLAGSRLGDIVLDPFMGSGTTAAVALQHGRQYLGCELNREYQLLQNERLAAVV